MTVFWAHMTIDWRKCWWQPGFVTGFFAVGVPYWLIPYNTINLPDAVIGAGLVVVAAAAALPMHADTRGKLSFSLRSFP